MSFHGDHKRFQFSSRTERLIWKTRPPSSSKEFCDLFFTLKRFVIIFDKGIIFDVNRWGQSRGKANAKIYLIKVFYVFGSPINLPHKWLSQIQRTILMLIVQQNYLRLHKIFCFVWEGNKSNFSVPSRCHRLEPSYAIRINFYATNLKINFLDDFMSLCKWLTLVHLDWKRLAGEARQGNWRFMLDQEQRTWRTRLNFRENRFLFDFLLNKLAWNLISSHESSERSFTIASIDKNSSRYWVKSNLFARNQKNILILCWFAEDSNSPRSIWCFSLFCCRSYRNNSLLSASFYQKENIYFFLKNLMLKVDRVKNVNKKSKIRKKINKNKSLRKK